MNKTGSRPDKWSPDKSDSLVQGIMPDVLKVSRVTPVDKGEHAADLSNYRPISTLYSFEQIFEKLVYLQVSTYLKRYNILINFSLVSSKEDRQNRQ